MREGGADLVLPRGTVPVTQSSGTEMVFGWHKKKKKKKVNLSSQLVGVGGGGGEWCNVLLGNVVFIVYESLFFFYHPGYLVFNVQDVIAR